MKLVNPKIKKVFILSDSLAAPRAEGENWTVYEHTWPYLIKLEFPEIEFVQVSIGSATTTDLLYQLRYWRAFEHDLTLVQAGLVDCLPRALFPVEQKFLGKILPGKFLKKIISRIAPFLRKTRKICYTKPTRFKENVMEIKNLFKDIVWIGIIDGGVERESRLPGHQKIVSKYNEMIEEIFGSSFLSPSLINREDKVEDGFHLSSVGHEKVKNMLLDFINNRNTGNTPSQDG